MRSCPADPKRKKSVVVQHGTIREHIVAGQVDVIPTQWRQFAQQIFRAGLTCQACIRPSAVLPICSRRRVKPSSSASVPFCIPSPALVVAFALLVSSDHCCYLPCISSEDRRRGQECVSAC